MADAVIAVSEGTKADVMRLFNVDEKRVRIIYNGIDPDEYKPTEATDALKQYGIDMFERVNVITRNGVLG